MVASMNATYNVKIPIKPVPVNNPYCLVRGMISKMAMAISMAGIIPARR